MNGACRLKISMDKVDPLWVDRMMMFLLWRIVGEKCGYIELMVIFEILCFFS